MVPLALILMCTFSSLFVIAVSRLLYTTLTQQRRRLSAITSITTLLLAGGCAAFYALVAPTEQVQAKPKIARVEALVGAGDTEHYQVTINGGGPVHVTGQATPHATVTVTNRAAAIPPIHVDARGQFEFDIQLDHQRSNHYRLIAQKNGYQTGTPVKIVVRPYQGERYNLTQRTSRQAARERAAKQRDQLRMQASYLTANKYTLAFTGRTVQTIRVWCDTDLAQAPLTEVQRYFDYGLQIGTKALNVHGKAPVVEVYAGADLIASSAADKHEQLVER